MRYHGSSAEALEITAAGMFGGVFASCDEDVALSHGGNLFGIVSPRDLSDYELNYEIEGAYEAALELAGGDESLADAMMNKGCPECGNYDGLEVQALRGKLAAKLGFTAVEMRDEHGTTWLCLPGCTATKISE